MLPSGCIPNDKGNLIRTDEPYSRLAFLTSQFAKECISLQLPAADERVAGGASRSYEIGVVGSVPVGDLASEAGGAAERMARRRRDADRGDETTRNFVAPIGGPSFDVIEQLEDGFLVENFVRDALSLT